MTELSVSMENVRAQVSGSLRQLEGRLRSSTTGSDGDARRELVEERDEWETCRLASAPESNDEISRAASAGGYPQATNGAEHRTLRTMSPSLGERESGRTKGVPMVLGLLSSMQKPKGSPSRTDSPRISATPVSEWSAVATPRDIHDDADIKHAGRHSERAGGEGGAGKSPPMPKQRERSGSVKVSQAQMVAVVEGQAALRGEVQEMRREQREMRGLLLKVGARVWVHASRHG